MQVMYIYLLVEEELFITGTLNFVPGMEFFITGTLNFVPGMKQFFADYKFIYHCAYSVIFFLAFKELFITGTLNFVLGMKFFITGTLNFVPGMKRSLNIASQNVTLCIGLFLMKELQIGY